MRLSERFVIVASAVAALLLCAVWAWADSTSARWSPRGVDQCTIAASMRVTGYEADACMKLLTEATRSPQLATDFAGTMQRSRFNFYFTATKNVVRFSRWFIWVQASHTIENERETLWQVYDTTDSQERCESRLPAAQDAMAVVLRENGDEADVLGGGIVKRREKTGTTSVYRFHCLPNTIDPRGLRVSGDLPVAAYSSASESGPSPLPCCLP